MIRVGEQYDVDDVHIDIIPIDSSIAKPNHYDSIIFDWDEIPVRIIDNQSMEPESIYMAPRGFTWQQWFNHPGYASDFFGNSQGYVVDAYGKNVVYGDDISEYVKANDLISDSDVYCII